MTADQIKAAYARQLKETITVRRYTGAGTSRPKFDTDVRGKATQYGPAALLVATILQGDQNVILFYDDLVAMQFPLPLRNSDVIVINGKENTIKNPGERKAPDGTMVVYDLQVRGQ